MSVFARFRRHRLHSGFTLLEMVIVVAVLGIILSVAYPPVRRAIAHARVNSSARVIAGDFEHAFSLANRQRQPVRIVLDESAMKYQITDRAGTVIRERLFGDGSDLHVSSMEASITTLDIFPNGLSSGPLTVTVGIGDYFQTITLTRSGQVRISS